MSKVLWESPDGHRRIAARDETHAAMESRTTHGWYGEGCTARTARALRLLADERAALEAERDSLKRERDDFAVLLTAIRGELRKWLPALPEDLRPGDYTKLAMLAGEAPEPAEAPQVEPAEAGGEEDGDEGR